MTMTIEPPTVPLPYTTHQSNQTKKNLLLGQLVDGNKTLDIIGFLTFWNVREVSITREAFAAALVAAGLSPDYAKEHNARSSLIRALNTLKEQKLVRMTHEDKNYATFQFTAEIKIGSGEDSRLNYHPEVIVIVDKEHYAMFKDEETTAFRDSIKKVDKPEGGQADDAEAIKDQLTAAFGLEMNAYKSSDITRYIQKIFTDEADIVSLRQQGSIYFVPAAYGSIVASVRTLVNEIGGTHSEFSSIPVPDVKDARKAVGDSFAEEVVEILAGMDKEVAEANAGSKDITEKWVNHRKATIEKIKKRIDMYSEVLGEKASELAGKFDIVSASLKIRVLDLT